uniref:Uncharacterized protein n=1 Tax=Avena sativa TaxID=4498 RepID=A0ACD5XD80_AVESA
MIDWNRRRYLAKENASGKKKTQPFTESDRSSTPSAFYCRSEFQPKSSSLQIIYSRRSKPKCLDQLSPPLPSSLLPPSSPCPYQSVPVSSNQAVRRSSAMAAQKRPAAVLDAGHATATQASATACKRSRTGMASTDDYDDVACLGKGAFGFVIKSRHRATGKIVAVKVLSCWNHTAVAELMREARFLEACSGNPYVVGYEGLVRNPITGQLCLAMEYVPAPSLHTFLWERRHEPPLPESKVRAFMWKLLTGAKMMHDRHVVHRDIKPANILIGQDGELVKICDLGLAITMSDSPPYSQAGTLPYLAPEMLLHKPNYDALVDTWSLGCVMAEMIIGKALFHDDHDGCHEFNDTGHIVQLWSIFRVLGMPDDQTWPEFKSLPLTAKALQLLPAGHKHNRLRDIFPEEKLSKEGFEVLQGLLTCNPDKRLTAAKALKHPWFATPRPSGTTAAAKVEVLPVRRKKMPRFMVALEVMKAQRV